MQDILQQTPNALVLRGYTPHKSVIEDQQMRSLSGACRRSCSSPQRQQCPKAVIFLCYSTDDPGRQRQRRRHLLATISIINNRSRAIASSTEVASAAGTSSTHKTLASSVRSSTSLLVDRASLNSARIAKHRDSSIGRAICSAETLETEARPKNELHMLSIRELTCATCSRQLSDPWVPSPRLLSTYIFLRQTCEKSLPAGVSCNPWSRGLEIPLYAKGSQWVVDQ